jgi:hypothetical protein
MSRRHLRWWLTNTRRVPPLSRGNIRKQRWLGIVVALFPTVLVAQTGQGSEAQNLRGPYARIAILRPHDGDTVEFEAGYIRHLEWHRQAKDTWVWYGWTIWAGERQRWFIYAKFGHSAASLDNPVSPAEDERDNVANVAPHVEYVGSGLYQYLPSLSRGTGEPQTTPRVELTTVELAPRTEKAFEAALSAGNPICMAKPSGIGWWREERFRAMSGCGRGPA